MSSPAAAPSIIYVGMDVHKDSITIAVLPSTAKNPTRLERLPNDLPKLKRFLDRTARGGELRVCYEASGAGYVVQRALREWGHACEVIAPSLIPKRSGVQRKHDTRDAADLARLYRAGEPTAVRIPSEADERVRDVVRCRETFQREILKSRHYLLKFLARRGFVFRDAPRCSMPLIIRRPPSRACSVSIRSAAFPHLHDVPNATEVWTVCWSRGVPDLLTRSTLMLNVGQALWGARLMAILLPHEHAGAQAPATSLTRAQFDAMLARVDNSSRWGPQDELGTLNLITPHVRRAAASEVRNGTSISLAREIIPAAKCELVPTTIEFLHLPDSVLGPSDNSVMWAGETVGLFYHGWANTHVDALSHLSYLGRAYNRRTVSRHEGPPDHGRIDAMRDGLMSRGVLVDIPRLRAKQRATTEAPLTVADLIAWEGQTGVRIRSGDRVLIRSGRWGPAEPRPRSLGVYPTVAEWLHRRGVAAVGDEGGTDMAATAVTGITSPFHVLALVGMGMPLMENLDLERLGAEAAKRSRWTFLFVAAPLRVRSATGSALNPLAVF